MTAPGCACGPVPRRPARAAASILSGLLLLILPKCPLCLAAWLTVATGLTISAATVTWMRTGILLLWTAAVAVFLWRRTSRARRSVRSRCAAVESSLIQFP